MRAVESWRTGSATGGRAKCEAIADKLALKLDQMHEESAAKLLQQQELARLRLVEVT